MARKEARRRAGVRGERPQRVGVRGLRVPAQRGVQDAQLPHQAGRGAAQGGRIVRRRREKKDGRAEKPRGGARRKRSARLVDVAPRCRETVRYTTHVEAFVDTTRARTRPLGPNQCALTGSTPRLSTFRSSANARSARNGSLNGDRFDESGSVSGCFACVCASEMTLRMPALKNAGVRCPILGSTFQSTKYPYRIASASANFRRAARSPTSSHSWSPAVADSNSDHHSPRSRSCSSRVVVHGVAVEVAHTPPQPARAAHDSPRASRTATRTRSPRRAPPSRGAADARRRRRATRRRSSRRRAPRRAPLPASTR